MEPALKKEFSDELLIKAREESFKEKGIYSPVSGITSSEDKKRLEAFHNFFNTRFKKMFGPLVDGTLGGEMAPDFLDKFTFCYWDTDIPNACCWPKALPDGRIYVAITKGMINLCETEGELMGVVGHEIGHHIHRLMKPYGNNEVEEQGSDIIAMMHMPNAGYHPRELISVFEKINAMYPISHREQIDLNDIFEPHPDMQTRNDINKMYVQIDDHKYTHLRETPLDKTDIALSGLTPMDGDLKIDDDLSMTLVVDPEKGQEEFAKILDNLQSLQVPLVSHGLLMDRYVENIWVRIINDYLTGKKNEAGIDLKTEENKNSATYSYDVLNRVYWNKLGALDSVATPQLLLDTLWNKMGQTEDDERHMSDLYKLECSMLNRFLGLSHTKFSSYFTTETNYETAYQERITGKNLDKYFENETHQEEFLPSEIIEARKYIKELLENPEKISLDIIPNDVLFYEEKRQLQQYKRSLPKEPEEKQEKNKKLRHLFGRLGRMVDSGYLSFRNAGYLLNPVIPVQEGQPHPLYELTHTPPKYTSGDWHERRFLYEINPLKRLMGTLGYYDSQTFGVDSDIRNFLTSDHWMGYSYSGLNSQDIQNLDEHSVFITSNAGGNLRCEYNNKTGQIVSIVPYDDEHEELIGQKCYNIRRRKYDGDSYHTADEQMKHSLDEHHKKLYEIKTSVLNTQMHYKLKDMVHSFGEENLRGEQVFDIVNFSRYYIQNLHEKRGVLNFRTGIPFVLDGMDWPYNTNEWTQVNPILAGRSSDNDEQKNTEYLFDFLNKQPQQTYLNIANGYIQLLERGLTDPQVAEQVIRASLLYETYDGQLKIIQKNPALFVLNPDIAFDSMDEKNSWHDYVETHFQRRILSALGKSPYVDLIDESVEFKSEKWFNRKDYSNVNNGNLKGLLTDMYEVAPALCARVFALYEEDENGNRTYMDLPVKTFADLKKMADLYTKNYAHKSDYRDKGFADLLKMVHDKYLEEGHSDIPMAFSVAVINAEFENSKVSFQPFSTPLQNRSVYEEKNINLLQGYINNVSNIENWPTSTQQSIRLMARVPNYSKSEYAQEPNLSDVVPQSIIQDYYDKICSAPTFEAKLSVLSWAVGQTSQYRRETWNLSKKTTRRLLDLSDNTDDKKTIWDNSLDNNIRLYLWLNDRHAFDGNLALQIKITDHLITQLEQAPIEKQEEYSFLLLGERADVPSPANKQRLMDMWVKSVVELVGSKDDMSDAYLKKIQPYIHKLHNKRIENTDRTKSERRKTAKRIITPREQHGKKFHRRKVISDYIYTALAPDMKRDLSRMLQEALVSQPRLSDILTSKDYIGLASNEENVFLAGKTEKILSSISTPSDAIATINFLLETPTPERVEKWSESLTNRFKGSNTFLDEGEISYDWAKNFHDEFWSKDFAVRLVGLTELFNRGYPDKSVKEEGQGFASQERIENMLNRILAPDIENREAFYAALYNYATAVDEKEMYKADTLLAGCLASAPKDSDNQMNLGETIRKFLESQGAAGIKVGQFLSAHEDIPADVRAELKKLTNHASTPSRHEVFKIIREKHPELMHMVMQNGGLGKCLGAASHYLTYEMGDKVVSISRPESATKATVVYNRLLTAIGKTLEEQPQNAHLLHVIRDAVTQAQSMNDIELDGNIGYEQSILATRLYDNVEMNIDGHAFTFKTMPWIKPDEKTGPYHVRIRDTSGYEYSQSFKIMEKAGGINYDEISDPTYKTAVAKANFLLNLRMILRGDVFDDDRHTGQLKVERLSDNSTRINLFDTGSMSTEPPTTEELHSFGQALHATSRAMMVLQSMGTKEQKINTLRRVFPSADTFDNLFDENGNVSKSALTICFNLAVNELRDKDGYAPLYISKVERSLANLSHFSNDIPNDEMLSLVTNLVKNTGNIHPEIINGMGKDNFILDHLIVQKILPNGRLNDDFISKTVQPIETHFVKLNDETVPYVRSDETQTSSGSTQHEKSDNLFVFPQTDIELNPVKQQPNDVSEHQIVTGNTKSTETVIAFDTIQAGLDELINPTDIDNKADRNAYEEALADMCMPSEGVAFIDHMNDTLNKMPNPKIRQKLAKKMVNAMHTIAKNMQNGKQADAISKEIFGYLSKTGIPYRLINKIAKRLPFKRAMALRLAFLNRGRLTLGKETVMQVLSQNITEAGRVWNHIDETKRNAMVSSVRLAVKEAPDVSVSSVSMTLATGLKRESTSNKSIETMGDIYTSDARGVKAQKATIRRNQDKKFQEGRAAADMSDIHEPQIKSNSTISNLFKRLTSLKNEKGIMADACAFTGNDINTIRRKKGNDGK